ncbi:DUF4817 domain-containing protein [Trichonephila clavipes]|uniref:DUF4817 domain-containing protein n=1 Tax=Trichonephila clavipes TaxID=2585209 RepID=A0A8X6RGR1_TRICX|nr:DUF4817 domain-containing protein [Trichonephila clavipes]
MEQDPTWVFNIWWTHEAHFSLHGDVNNHNCQICVTSNPREYTQKPLHSPKVTAWCGFTGSFIIGAFFFETQCPVNGWITETVNAQRYLTLLKETVVPCLIQRGQISNVTFMQDGATSHTANSVKAFLIQTFGEDRIVSRRCRYPWPPRSPDLTPADFWLWGYLKSRVYLSGPSSLSELKEWYPQRSILHTSGHVALYRCWIYHSSGMSSPLWWWSCGTYSGVIKLLKFSVHYLCIVYVICEHQRHLPDDFRNIFFSGLKKIP